MWELPCQEFRLWNRFFYMPKIRVRYFSVRALFLSITKMEDINEIDIYMRQKLEAFLFFCDGCRGSREERRKESTE